MQSEVAALRRNTLERPAVDMAADKVPTNLRLLLVGTDAAAASAGWTFGFVVAKPSGASVVMTGLLVAVAVGCSLALMASHRLYWSRVISVRAVELQLLLRTLVLTTIGLLALGAAVPTLHLSGAELASGGTAAFIALASSRGAYRGWIARQRRAGRCGRKVILVGMNAETDELVELLQDHPESGLVIVGVVGGQHHSLPIDVPWFGGYERTVAAAREAEATGAILVSSAIPNDVLNSLCRQLLTAGIHVQLANGLRRIAHRRMRVVPVAHESLIYLEPATLSRWQLGSKRAVDVVVASVLLLLTLPVMAAAALAIKLTDRGPVFFRQVRVGRDGKHFSLYKLRTMVPDAESRLAEVAALNERSGPLFKLSADPRLTRVGRLLRASSIDELPQLYNVIRGTMSLVGPRPALPHEVEQFDQELQSRIDVAPGITGLWQVEARDNPAFGAYRRLDLFYVENWSVALDLSILLSTAGVVTGRLLKAVRPAQCQGRGSTLVLD